MNYKIEIEKDVRRLGWWAAIKFTDSTLYAFAITPERAIDELFIWLRARGYVQ